MSVDFYSLRSLLRLPLGVTFVQATARSSNSRISIAALCSNGYVLAYSEHDCKRRVKQLRWEKTYKVLIDAACTNLVMVSGKGEVRVSPLLTSPAVEPLQETAQIVYSAQSHNMGVTDAVCWQTCTGVQVAILGFDNREIIFIDLVSGDVLLCLQSPVPIHTMVVASSDTNSHKSVLIVSTNRGEKFHLFLESRADPRIVFPPDPKTMFLPLAKFDTAVQIESQGDLVVAHTVGSPLIEVYDGDLLAGRPMHVLNLPDEFAENIDGKFWSQDIFFLHSENILYLLSQSSLDVLSKRQNTVSPLLTKYQLQSTIVNIHGTQYLGDVKAKETAFSPLDVFPCQIYITTKDSIHVLSPKASLQRTFVQLALEGSYAKCEHFSMLFPKLSLLKLYETAAELELQQQNFTKAIRLYQMSKCGQLKRVCHFVCYGYLAELLAYTQVLLNTRCHELQVLDKPHLANFAVLCFVHQILEKHDQRDAITKAFKTFLVENVHYSDIVVIRTLCNFKLYSLLSYFALLRNQLSLMIEFLFKNLSGPSDTQSCQSYSSSILKYEQEFIQECLTAHPSIVFCLVGNCSVLSKYIKTCCDMLQISQCTQRLAAIFDPSKPTNKLAIRKLILTPRRQRCAKSETSLISADSLDNFMEDDSVSEQDIIKLFLFILLLLNRQSPPEYKPSLLRVFEFNPQSSRQFTPNGVHISAGPGYGALCARGKAYVWGQNKFGRFGFGEPSMDICGPVRVQLLDIMKVNVSQVACGTNHTLFLTDHGLFAAGGSQFGQLGLGTEIKRSCHPQLVETLQEHTIKHISCGSHHSAALTAAGRVYCWGWGVHGQLGQGSTLDCFEPALVKGFPSSAVQVAAGGAHTVVLCSDGRVYSFGCNAFGQLGLGCRTKFSRPQLVRLSCSITIIATGFFQTYAISNKPAYRIYTWGCNPQTLRLQAQSQKKLRQQVSGDKSLVADDSNPLAYLSPSLLGELKQGVNCMSVGYNHMALITDRGEVMTCGRNLEGQLGHGHRKDLKTPTAVSSLSNRRMVAVSCGKDFTVAADNSGKVLAWGQNECGQLAMRPATLTPTPRDESLSRIITVRTNKRVITIPHTQKQGELKPVVCSGFPNDISSANIPNLDISDMELSVRQRLFFTSHADRLLSCPSLSLLDATPFVGGAALHATLSIFYSSYDSSMMLDHSDSLGDHQAAAKICVIEGHLARALRHQLMAVQWSGNPRQSLYDTIDYYCCLVGETMTTEVVKDFLNIAITSWVELFYPVMELESILCRYTDRIGLPLGLLLFSDSKAVAEACLGVEGVAEKFSSDFNQTLMDIVNGALNSPEGDAAACTGVIDITGCGNILDEIRKEDGMSLSSSEKFRRKLSSQVKQQIKQNALPPPPIMVSSLDAKRLSKSSNGNSLVFSCGHHIAPQDMDLSPMKGVLSQDKLDTLSRLYSQKNGPIPLACPACVLDRLSSSLREEDSMYRRE